MSWRPPARYLIKKRAFSLSHISLSLLTIIPLVPSQTPSPSTWTQVPLKKDVPLEHWIQFDAEPMQVLHGDKHEEHCVSLLNAPVGHWTPFDVIDDFRLHLLESRMKSFSQDVQAPESAEHLEHPIPHTERVVRRGEEKERYTKSYFDNHQWRSNSSLPHTEHRLCHF